MRGDAPTPSKSVLNRSQRSFDKTLRIELEGIGQIQRIWTSPIIDPAGYTHANAFVSLTIIEDSNPGTDFAIAGSIAAVHGSEGAPGFMTAIGQGIPIGVTPVKIFEGLGIEHRLPVMKVSIARRLGQVLTTGVGFVLYALGVPLGRVLTVNVSGVVVCGRSY